MRLRYILFLVLFLSSCKVITPNSKDSAWNGYKDDCSSKPIQHNYWPPNMNFGKGTSYYYSVPVEHGFVVLKNNDTISGLIKNMRHILILPESKKKGNDIIKLEPSEINYFRGYDDSIKTDQCYTDFAGLPNRNGSSVMWRLLGKINGNRILDDFTFNYGNTGTKGSVSRMVLINKYDSVIKIYSWSPFRSIKGSLNRFINKRYKANTHKSDFKTIREMINYILNKENENRH